MFTLQQSIIRNWKRQQVIDLHYLLYKKCDHIQLTSLLLQDLRKEITKQPLKWSTYFIVKLNALIHICVLKQLDFGKIPKCCAFNEKMPATHTNPFKRITTSGAALHIFGKIFCQCFSKIRDRIKSAHLLTVVEI